MGTPTASNSLRTYPAPTPTRSRPLETTSMVASSLARTTGLRNGSTMMPLPTLIGVVAAAIRPRETSVAGGGGGGGGERGARGWGGGPHPVLPGPPRLEPGVLRVPRAPDRHVRI